MGLYTHSKKDKLYAGREAHCFHTNQKITLIFSLQICFETPKAIMNVATAESLEGGRRGGREREKGGGGRGKERGREREREREKETDRHKTKKPEVRSKTVNLQRRQTTLTLLGEYQSLIAVLPFSVFLKRFRQTMRMTH